MPAGKVTVAAYAASNAIDGIDYWRKVYGAAETLFFGLSLGWFPSGGYVPFAEDPGGWLRSITLPAKTFADLVGRLSKERVDLNLEESTNTVTVKCGSAAVILSS